MLAATVANYAGKVRSDDAGMARPTDFLPALTEHQPAQRDEPQLLADPAQQSALMRRRLFKKED